MKTYVGLGSSYATKTEMDFVEGVATIMSDLGWFLYTTQKGGVDQAFAYGAAADQRILWPQRKMELTQQMRTIGEAHHSSWIGYRDYHQDELAMNVQMLLGQDCKKPVNALVYMQQKGDAVMYAGCINHALRIADAYKIPHFNVLTEMEKLEEFLQQEAV